MPLIKTPEEPVTIEPPQPGDEPCTAAGLPLMNTFDDPSVTVEPQVRNAWEVLAIYQRLGQIPGLEYVF